MSEKFNTACSLFYEKKKQVPSKEFPFLISSSSSSQSSFDRVQNHGIHNIRERSSVT